MRTFYIFNINKNFYNLMKNNPYHLYKTMEDIHSFDKNDSVGTAEFLESLGEDGSRILDQGTLNSREENSYVLRVWPTIEVDGDFGGQVWKGKLRITGDQVR